MKLGINLLFLEPGKVGGTEIITVKFLEHLDKEFARENQVYIYCNKKFANQYDFKNLNPIPLISSSKNKAIRLFVELFILPVYLIKHKITVLHSLGYTSPLITHCPKIATIHDLQYKYCPQTVSLLTRKTYQYLIPLVILSNKAILTASQTSRQQIKKNFPKLTHNKPVKKIYWGSPVKTHPPLALEERDKIIFTPSATHSHKNLPFLIESFNDLIHLENFKDYKLVISGTAGKQQEFVIQLINSLKLKNRIDFLGWVPYQVVVKTMRKASLCVLPSLYEGFGLPALEAMVLGTPLVLSDIPIFSEIVGDAGLFFDPNSRPEFHDSLTKIIESPRLSKKLIRRGQKRARKFDWDKNINQTVETYKLYSL